MIALVVTIIVLLILAGITIAMITGDNGILGQAGQAKIDTEVKQYQEKIDEIKTRTLSRDYQGNLDGFLDKLVEKIKKDSMFENAQEVSANYETDIVTVITEEGYIFDVTIHETTYVGIKGEETDITKINVTFAKEPSSWTNKKVKVTLTANSNSVNIEYKINDGEWQKYNGNIEIEDNGTKITARARNNEDKTGPETEETIDIIDRLQPRDFTPTITPGKTSLKIIANVEDEDATEIDGKSGIKGYKFSSNNGGNWTDLKEENTYTFENLQQNQTYQIKVKAIDNAGNEKEVGPFSGTTSDSGEEIPEGTIHFEQTPRKDTWTKNAVRLRIYTDVTGNDIEYSYDGKNFEEYTGELEITDNNTKVYARLKNNNTSGEVSEYIVENIDRLAPYNFALSVTNTGSTTLSVTGSTDDWDPTDTDGKSGIKEYTYSKDGGKTYEGSQAEGTYTFTGLTPGQTYQIRIKATDNAGNETESSTYDVKTTTPPNPNTDITFVKNPSSWTKGPVTVTINNSADSYYILQYKTSNTDWDTYNKGNSITVSDNGTIISARYKDPNSDYTTEEVQTTVDNIDRLGPNAFTPSVGNITENTIEIRANNVTDKAATSTDGQSGIRGYVFGMSSDGGSSYYWRTEQTSNTYTFGNLSPGTTYYFKVKAIDNAGNEITSNQTSGTTTKITVPDGEDYITFDYSPRDWTNRSVTITITSTAGSQYEIQYSLNGTNWYTYNSSSKPTRSSNGPVYARLKYGNSYGTPATGNVTKIDTQKPSGTATSVTSGSSAIITISTSDSGGSGVSTSYNTTTSNITKLNSSQYEVTANGTYYFIVYDNAGNSTSFSCIVNDIKDREVLVGDYVNYSPSGSSSTTITDLGTTQTIYREDLDYQVLEINGNYATLASSSTSTRLKGTALQVYNNMVYVLNNTAKTLYSNSSLGTTARSIKASDVTDKIEDGYEYHNDSTYIGYGNSKTFYNIDYPNIYSQEYNGYLEEDEQNAPVTGYSTASSMTIKNTYYNFGNVANLKNHMKPAKTQNSDNDTEIYYNMLVMHSGCVYANRAVIVDEANNSVGFVHRFGNPMAAGGGGSLDSVVVSTLSPMRIIVENVPVDRINLNSGDGTQSSPWGMN